MIRTSNFYLQQYSFLNKNIFGKCVYDLLINQLNILLIEASVRSRTIDPLPEIRQHHFTQHDNTLDSIDLGTPPPYSKLNDIQNQTIDTISPSRLSHSPNLYILNYFQNYGTFVVTKQLSLGACKLATLSTFRVKNLYECQRKPINSLSVTLTYTKILTPKPVHSNICEGFVDSKLSYKPLKRSPEYWKKEVEKVKHGDISQYEMYLEKTRKLEVQAQRKQQQIEANRERAGIDDIIEVNEMYIESLQGKLELLNQIESFK